MRASVFVLESGKVTIPKPIREELDISKDDVVEIEVSVSDE